ncbi:MAG: DUF5711 family protein [Oscillospiraceae bacterium]
MSNDIYSRRSRIKNRKMSKNQNYQRNRMIVICSAAFLIIIIIGMILTKDKWQSELQRIGIYSANSYDYERTEDGIIINSGNLAEENFPILLSDSSDYQVGIMEKNLVILSDTDFSIYSPSGELIESRSHDYSNVILKYENGRSLIYESGGKKFRVETNKKTEFEKNIDDSIIFARISNEGYVALVSTSDAYACMLTIYDPKGNAIYFRGSVSRIIEVCFNNDSTGCRVSIMDANSGRLVSTVYGFSFRDTDSSKSKNRLTADAAELNSGEYIYGETEEFYHNVPDMVTEADYDAEVTDEIADTFNENIPAEENVTSEPAVTADIFSLDGNNDDKDANNDISWRTNLLDTLCISLNSTLSDKMIIIGDNQYGYYDESGKYLGGFNYKNALVAGECYDEKLVMIFYDDERRKSSVIIVPGAESNPIEKISDDKMKCISCEENFAYVMTEREIIAYDYEGNISAKAPVSNVYKSFLKSGNTVFLIGNSKIDKINFISN